MYISKNFSRSEFACNCGCGFNTVDVELIEIVQDVRDYFDQPVSINSGCRCSYWNNKVGGTSKSQHLIGRAADIVVKNKKPVEVYKYLCDKYPDLYGFGLYTTFVHVDSRSYKARWC